MRNTAQGIRNPTNDWNPESKFYWQILKSSIWNRESTAWNPESKTVLDSPTWIEAIIAGSRGSLSKFVEHHFDSLPHTEQTNSKSWYITVDNIHRGLRMTPNLVPGFSVGENPSLVKNRDFGGFKRTMISYRFHAMSTRPHRGEWPKTATRISASMQCKRCVSRDPMFYSSGHVLVCGPIRAQDRRRCRWSERKTLWRKAKR